MGGAMDRARAARSVLERLGSIEKELDGLASAIRHAGSGYAGLFDAVKVRQEQLEAVYHPGITLVEDVEAVAEAAEHLSGGEDGERTLGIHREGEPAPGEPGPGVQSRFRLAALQRRRCEEPGSRGTRVLRPDRRRDCLPFATRGQR